MRHVRAAQAIVLSLVLALAIAPVSAFAEEEDPTPVVPVTPVVPTDPVPTVPNPAPVVVVRSYTTSDLRLVIGKPFALTINVYNATGRRADNVVVSLGASTAPAAAAATTGGGLAVLGTGNAKYLGLLKGQREAGVTFDVIAGPGTAPGATTVPVTVSFEHEGVRQEVTYTIGLLLERDALLSLVTAELPDSVMQGETFPATFEVANASAFALSGVTLSVEASGAAVTEGSYFLGTMDAATTEGLDVSITPENAGPLEIAIVLTYRDDFGRIQTFRETRTVTVEAMPEQTANEGEPIDEEQPADNWFVRFIKSLFGIGS